MHPAFPLAAMVFPLWESRVGIVPGELVSPFSEYVTC